MSKDLFQKAAEAPALLLDSAIEETRKLEESFFGKPLRKARDYWHMLGPGLTTGAADDDPSGIATYSQTGATYGFQLLWLAPLTFPLMAVVQEMCARIGLVTGRGLAANIRLHFSRRMLLFCTALLLVANVLNIGADLGAMAQALRLLVPGFSLPLAVILFAVASLFLQIFIAYARYAAYLKWLALILLSYVVTAFVVPGIHWGEVLHEMILPSFHLSKEQVILICAILGTTISPYLFFWQTSQEVEERILEGKTTIKSRQGVEPEKVRDMRADVWSGMFLSNAVMFFIIVTCSATLHSAGVTNIATAADAAAALRPLAGDKAYLLFALGIIGTGMLAIPVLAGSLSYALSESFGWRTGLYRRLNEASAFYGVIIISVMLGIGMNFLGIDSIKALIFSAVANGLVAPVILVLIMLLATNKQLMGKWVSGPIPRFFGWFTVVLMVVAGLATIGSAFL